MTISPEQLAEWKRLAKAATPPWRLHWVNDAVPALIAEVERLTALATDESARTLVEWLRAEAGGEPRDEDTETGLETAAYEAADTILALAAERDKERERDMLRTAKDAAETANVEYGRAQEMLRRRAEAAERERDELREALDIIARGYTDRFPGAPDAMTSTPEDFRSAMWAWSEHVARAALAKWEKKP